MTLTYTWKLTGLKKTDNPSIELNDIIVQTYWECTGTDENGNSGTFTGATPFDPSKVDPEDFTSYENLTEAQVLGWIQDLVNNDLNYKAHIEERIMKQIESLNIKTVDSKDFPWAENTNNGEA